MSAGASNSPVYDFTSLDYESVNEDLIRYSQARFPDELWTDYNDSNFGTGLIENLSYSTDLLAYNGNAQNLETVVTTLIREQNFRNIAKSLDYTLKSASPSTSIERLTLDPGGAYPFVVSKHLQFSTQNNIVFQPDADVSVGSFPPSGYVDVPITQGEEQFEEVLGTTNGLANQAFELKVPYLIDGTLIVQVGLEAYTPVSNFIAAGSTEKIYVIETDQDGITTIILGDGNNGTIPPRGLLVRGTYKTGGGIATNLAVNTIRRVYGTSDGSVIPTQILSVTNVKTASGGAQKQSLANAKQNLPLTLKANDRAVALPDYAALAVKLVPGVLKAQAVSGRPQGGSTPILMFIVPNGGGNPSSSLANLVITNLRNKRMAGKRIRVMNPVYVDVLIESDTYVQQNSPALDVGNKQKLVFTNKFDMEAVDFGQTFDLQDAYDETAPNVLPGINRIFYKTFTVKPYFARHVNTPTTGNGTVEYITVNLPLVQRREWLIRVLAPSGPVLVNRFQVIERRLGTVTSVTDNLVIDEAASYEANELYDGDWIFHPRPEEINTTFDILGNTVQSITTDPGLLVVTEPGDPYVVEKSSGSIGKILRTQVSADVTASNFLTVVSADSWQVGDWLHISDGINDADFFQVINAAGSTLTLNRAITTTAGANVDYAWRSSDEEVTFSVVDGTSPFVVGDELYVDTYPRTGDLVLRPENFPQLKDENFFINLIGGVK